MELKEEYDNGTQDTLRLLVEMDNGVGPVNRAYPAHLRSYPAHLMQRLLRALCCLILAAAACSKAPLPVPGALSPNLNLPDTSGNMLSLSQFKGQVVFLNFWATWCDICREEMPALQGIYLRHRKRGFVILAPSIDKGGRKDVLPFLARNAFTYPVLLSDPRTAERFGVRGLPTAYLIDREGRIVRKYSGPVDLSSLENDILNMLGKTAS